MRTRILYVISFAAFLRPFAQLIYVPSGVTMRAELGTTTAVIGLTLSVYGLLLAVSQIAYGPLVDRLDGKRVLLTGLVCFALGSLMGFLTSGVALLLIARGLQALGISAAAAVGLALIADLFPPADRGRAMGVFSMFNSAGAAAGPVVGAGLGAWLSWRADFAFLALAGLALMLFALWQLPAQPAHAEKVGPREVLLIARTPATFGAIVLGLVQFYGLYTVHTLLPVLLTERLGMTEGSIGLIVSMVPVGVIAGTHLGGKIADAQGLRLPLLLGALSMAVVFCALTTVSAVAVPSTPALIVAALVLCFGLSVGLGTPAQLTIMVEFFPTIRATAGALQFFARFLGSTIAPTVAGYLADRFTLSLGFASAAFLLTLTIPIAFLTISNPRSATKREGAPIQLPRDWYGRRS